MSRASLALSTLLVGAIPAQDSVEKWVAPADEAARTNPVPPSPDALKRGRGLYHQHCATCHGDKGRGDGPYARMHARRSKPPRDLTLPEIQTRLTDGEIFWKISSGLRLGERIIMPAFEADIRSPEDRWKVVLHVRLLGQGADRP